MARINLLPWREEQRLKRNREFLTLIAMVTLMALAAAFATWLFFNTQLAEQQTANELITAENQKLDKALKEIESLEQRREEIISRMKVIQDLQGKRPIPVRVWDELARSIPEAAYLTKLVRKDNLLVLNGKAVNPSIVSNLISNLDKSGWMENSGFRIIEKKDEKLPSNNVGSGETFFPEDNYVKFEVTTQVKLSNTEKDTANADDASTADSAGGDE